MQTRKWLSLAAVSVLAVGAIAGEPPQPTPTPTPTPTPPPAALTNPKAKLEVPETFFDFGYVPQGASISHVFWLKSTGEDTLRITDVRPG